MKAYSTFDCLTPQLEVFYLTGYNSPLRKLPAQGVHDDVYGISTLIEVGEDRVFFFSTDWIGVEKDFYQDLSSRLNEKYGINKQLVFVTSTHNHQSTGGQFIHDRNDHFDQEYYDFVINTAIAGFETCLNNLQEVEAYYGSKVITGYYGNRVEMDKLADNEVILVEFRNKENKVVAALCNWAVHSTALTPNNALLTSEFAGNTRKYYSEIKGYAPNMIVGAAGDCSTRPTRQGNDFAELERISRGMAEEISKIEVNQKLDLNLEYINYFVYDVEVVIDHDEVQAILDANEEELKTATDFDRIKILNSMRGPLTRKLSMDKEEAHWFAETVKLNDLELVITPCELASKFGKEIKALSKAKCCLIVGYCNDQGSYMFPEEYYGKTFETISTSIPASEVLAYVNKIKDNL